MGCAGSKTANQPTTGQKFVAAGHPTGHTGVPQVEGKDYIAPVRDDIGFFGDSLLGGSTYKSPEQVQREFAKLGAPDVKSEVYANGANGANAQGKQGYSVMPAAQTYPSQGFPPPGYGGMGGFPQPQGYGYPQQGGMYPAPQGYGAPPPGYAPHYGIVPGATPVGYPTSAPPASTEQTYYPSTPVTVTAVPAGPDQPEQLTKQ